MKQSLQSIFQKILLSSLLLIGASAFADNDHNLFFKNGTLAIAASFEGVPESGKEAIILLQAKDAQTQQPVEIAEQLKVILWMPDMGHGSSPTRIQKAVDTNGNALPGAYRVSNIHFMMGGVWEVRVQLKDAAGKVEMQAFTVEIAGDGHGHH